MDWLKKIEQDFYKQIGGAKALSGAVMHLHSERHNIDLALGKGEGKPLVENQPYHTASVGKLFTVTLIAMLVEQGKANFSDKITMYLDDAIVSNLFVYKGTDYKHDVSIEQLMTHRSGVADYFDDKVSQGSKMMDEIINRPDHFYTPLELIDFTRTRQKAVSKPGIKTHYSDTGYILLGLIIEKLTDMTFAEVLKTFIFDTLKMDDSYLMFYTKPTNQPAPEIMSLWLKNKDIKGYESLSVDWSGGGIVTTTADQIKFMRALYGGQLITQETLKLMERPHGKFMNGIDYGMGVMTFKFEGFFFLLRGLPRLRGHIGVNASLMLYDEENDMIYVGGFGKLGEVPRHVRWLIQVVSTYVKVLK